MPSETEQYALHVPDVYFMAYELRIWQGRGKIVP